ncbi:FAD-dependent oxidoreductase [Demequina sp. NBRC 110052]|uniref:FAD-dependent oxidoreductase n=1 Tax=Demequina sp. NBRC 110052 TaxID=1570341 RepID=UPI000A000D31|nr:FAD-dependent oxidoreductase [Demequina sp. NBRC 110052]
MNVVVIGHGMVGSRFVEDLVARMPDARVTILGKEPEGPYNRVLLSAVVAGKTDASMLAMSAVDPARASVLDGVHAVHVNRAARTVTDSRGDVHEYDRLVIATGSAARIPDIQGIATDRGLVPGVSVLKDLADAQGVLARLPKARRAVVLGAGVLGIEVATGLAARGVAVTLVHHAGRVMERQLGDAAAGIATGALHQLGVKVVTGASVAGALERRGTLTGVRLTDGGEALTDMLVMCAGTIPETALARRAGLPCERGIVVDAQLASPADPRVFAIGDCAQPPEGGTGLVAQGWDQARRLVDAWCDGETAAIDQAKAGLTDVVRVKASGLDVVTMGLSGKFDHGDRELRAVRLADPSVGRFVEVVVSNGLLVGATVVGDKQCASELAAMYTRAIPVPADPAHLIVRPLAGASPAAAAKNVEDLDDDATVCQCNTVSKGRIVAAIGDGCANVADVAQATRASTGCGDCRTNVQRLIEAHAAPAATTTDSGAAAPRIPALAG